MGKKQKIGKIAGFILKLLELLKNKQNEEIVEYKVEEKSFIIKNIRRFTQEILPKYFKHRNYSSFVRQVNLYDFHKLKQQGKQEIYNHQFFDLNNIKQLKKIKRKRMGNQKQRIAKKGNNFSESEGEGDEDVDYEYQSQSQQPRSSDPQQNHHNSQIEFDMQQLHKKKIFLQNKIKLEQMANEKLQDQNVKLKQFFTSQNIQFFKDMLRILENLLLSQFNQGYIDIISYNKLLRYIFQQNQKLIRQETDRAILNDQRRRQDKQVKQPSYKQSAFLSLIKQYLTKKKDHLTIFSFIQLLKQFVQRQQSGQHLMNDLIKESMFYRPVQHLQKQQVISKVRAEKQKKQEKKENYFYNEKQKLKSNINLTKGIECKIKLKKQKKSSEDQDYLPNHR